MRLYINEESFGAARDNYAKELQAALINAGRSVRGSAVRSEIIARALEDLKRFDRKLEDLLRSGALKDLPGLRNASQSQIRNYRHLTVGPWRGVFLVSPDGKSAVAVVFSREPHDLSARLNEI